MEGWRGFQESFGDFTLAPSAGFNETVGLVEGPVDELLDQEDPALIRIIQKRFLERPPPPGPLKLAQVD